MILPETGMGACAAGVRGAPGMLRPEAALARDPRMMGNGFRVDRIAPGRGGSNLGAAADAIVAPLARTLHHPLDGPPSRAGEDQE